MSDASWWTERELDRSRLETFAEPVLDRVATAISAGRFPHALLLSGPAGLGRELAAVETAAMLVCGGDPWRDGQCARRVRGGTHPDVAAVLPQGASRQIKIEQVRQIVDGAPSRPYEGASRVWILDGVEAEHLGPAAANAFLKVLEEPPRHCRFVLLASNSVAVLPTIRSRCQQLLLPGPAEVAGRLGLEVPPGLAGAMLAGSDVEALVEAARMALRQAFNGEIRELLCLPQLVPSEVSAAEVVAAAALEEATAGAVPDLVPELVGLAADVMAVDHRVRELNLTADRQLVSALLRWYQHLPRVQSPKSKVQSLKPKLGGTV